MPTPDAQPAGPPRSAAPALGGARRVAYGVRLTVAVAGFVVLTVATAVGILLVTSVWRLALAATGGDPVHARWRNPALHFVALWSRIWPVWMHGIMGIRLDRSRAPAPIPAGTVRLLLAAHPPAAQGMMLVGDCFARVARRRWFAPVKKELMALIRVPTEALGIILPIDRSVGDAAVQAIDASLRDVPLDGVCVLIFPEGHRISRARREAAWRFAADRGLPPMRHHLEPRPRGSCAMVRALRDRADAEGLQLQVHFARYGFDRPGWGEPDGLARSMGAAMWWSAEDVTDAALAVAEDPDAFAEWLRGCFVDADERLDVSPFIDAAPGTP